MLLILINDWLPRLKYLKRWNKCFLWGFEKLSTYLKIWNKQGYDKVIWNKPIFQDFGKKLFFTQHMRLKKWHSDAKYRIGRHSLSSVGIHMFRLRSCIMWLEPQEIIPCGPHIRHCQLKHKMATISVRPSKSSHRIRK